ncbi:hypothetical protein [Halobaculum sp. MBLA0143]|uniref:hypothetical protein n=1 Tax=Halobaculum sp. MBLA0143 TaxID=3079933 RepID=UPI0035252635
MPDAQLNGLYVAAFVESAGEVSAVFEKRAMQMLTENNIDDLDEDSWYYAEDFEEAMVEIEEQVGSMTTQQAGEKMIEVNEQIPAQDSARDGFDVLKEQHESSYRGYSVDEVGQYRVDRLSEDHFCVATYGGWGYPEAFTKGLLKGVIQETEAGVTNPDLDPTDTEGEEVFAYEVSW